MTTARDIIEQVAHKHGLEPEQLLNGTKKHSVCFARFEAMHRMRTESENGKRSLPWIAKQLNRSCHGTVINGIRRFAEIQGEGQ